MSDLFDSAAGAVGGLLEPVAPALDFLGLGANDPAGRQPEDPGSLIESIGRGFQDAVMAGPAGLAAGAASIAQSNVSQRDRLIFGGLLLAGAAGAGRAAYHRWRAAPSALGVELPATFDPLVRMRAAPGHFTEPSRRNLALRSEFPGLRRRSLDVMLAEDSGARARALARFSPRSEGPDERLAGIAARLDQYESTYGPETGNFDWAVFDRAEDLGKLKSRSGRKLRELYTRFADGEELSEEDWTELSVNVRATADALEYFNADLTLGLTGRLHSIEFGDTGPVPVVRYSLPEAGDVFGDELHRVQMLKSLNPGVQYARAVRIIEDLYRQGAEDMAARAQGRASALASPVELGENWYQKSHDDLVKLAGGEGPLHDRLTAIVSLTSAEENWTTNIRKARQVERLLANPEVADPDFQAWLRSRSAGTGETYEGTLDRQHRRTFSKLHKQVTKTWQLSVPAGDLQKILRLATEEPQDLFATTQATKQKNFYLNLLDPKNPAPVTVDRHAFDIFWGMDSGVQKRPIYDTLGGGETSYDVIADAYRQAADNLSAEFGELLPHQVQSMAWEVWRINKAAHGRMGWQRGNPYRIKLDGEENPAFLALVGAGNEMPGNLTGRPGEVLPVVALRTEAGDMTLFVDQYDVTHAAGVDPRTDYWARNMYPGPLGRDGVPRWVASEPLPVRSLDAVDEAVLKNPSAIVETVPAGTYPGFAAGDTISFDWVYGRRLPAWATRAEEQRGGFARSRPARSTERLGRLDMVDGDTARNALETHAWAVFEAPSRNLVPALRKAGFDPIELSEGENPALLVFGIEPQAAADLVPKGTVFTHTGEVTNVRLAELDSARLGALLEENDGFSIDPRTGEPLAGGVVVATLDSPELKVPVDEWTDDVLDEFVSAHSAQLARPGAVLGGWFDRDANEYVLDISEATDAARVGDQMVRRNQKAAFNLDTFEEVPNPRFVDGEPAAPPAAWIVPNRAGEVVELAPQRRNGDMAPARVDEKVTRFHYKLDQREAHLIAALADDLEFAGANNLTLYSRQPNIDGFERAREHVFKGPGGLKVVRTADETIGASNAVPVHVRTARGLPDRPVEIDPERIGTDHITAEQRGKKYVITVEAEGDLHSKVRDAETLAHRVGFDNVELVFEGETIPLYRPAKPTSKHQADRYVSAVGIDVPKTTRQPARDDANVRGVRVISRFGKGDAQSMSPQTQAEIARALDDFLAVHPEVAEVWRLSWVSVDRQMHGKVAGLRSPNSYIAAVNPEPGTGIHLNEEMFANEDVLRADLDRMWHKGWLSAPGVHGIIMHELGHIMRGVVELLEVGSVNKKRKAPAPIMAELGRLYEQAAKTPHSTSGRGIVDIEEFIAESVADVVSGQNRWPASRKVYDTLVAHLNAARPNSRQFWGKVAG